MLMSKDLKTIFITGITGKIGKQFAIGLSSLGYKIVFSVRKKEKTKIIEKQLLNLGASYAKGIHVDLEDENFIKKISYQLRKEKLYPEILINNARNKKYLQPNKYGYLSRKFWQGEFLMNVIVPYELSMYLSNSKKSKLKKIINISSIYGVVAPQLDIYDNPLVDSSINYGTTKAAQIHLTKELAVRLSSKKINVNTISFGGLKGGTNETLRKKYSNLTLSKKMMNEQDVFGALKFLISSEANYINGHNLLVDDGWTIK